MGWAMRKAAKAAGFGVGKGKQIIVQDGDKMEVENHTHKVVTSVFTVDGGEHRVETADGEAILVANWDSPEQVMMCTFRKADGAQQPSNKRYMVGDQMILELISPKGLVCKRTFSKQ